MFSVAELVARFSRFSIQDFQFIEMDEVHHEDARAQAILIRMPQRWFREAYPVTTCVLGEF
jgi:hypothetical protein